MNFISSSNVRLVFFLFNFDVIKDLVQSGASAREVHQRSTMGAPRVETVNTPSSRENLAITSS